MGAPAWHRQPDTNATAHAGTQQLWGHREVGTAEGGALDSRQIPCCLLLPLAGSAAL